MGKKYTTLLFIITLYILCTGLLAKPVTLQILMTTDTHGRFYPYNYETNKPDYSGSLAQDATIIQNLRAKYPNNTIVVDNGDIIQENSQVLFVHEKKNPMIVALNYIGYNLINLGNHEFNYGIPVLKKQIAQFKAVDGNKNSVLCGNVYTEAGKRIFSPYKIVTTKDKIKVGFIGMVSPNIKRWDSDNLKNYKVTNPVDETQKIIDKIKDEVDLLVAIDHMGIEPEYGVEGSGAIDIAKSCPELDLIISGHSHMSIPGDYYYKGKIYSADKATEEIKENGILIITASCRGEAVGQVLFKFSETPKGKYSIENKAEDITSKLFTAEYENDGKTKHIKPDPELMKILKPYHELALKDANKVIGKLIGNSPLAPEDKVKGISQRELQPNAMSQLINDVQIYYADKMMKGKPVKVSAASLLRLDGNIYPGPIRKSDVSLIYKYPNTLYVLKMNGKQLKQFMEFCAKFFNQYKPGDLTISFNPDFRSYLFCNFTGVNYDINISKPFGSRIKNLTWADKTPIKPDDIFLLSTNNYMAESQLATYGSVFQKEDNLPTIVAKSDDFSNMGNMQNMIANYIEKVKNGKIKPYCTPNWKIVGNSWNIKQRDMAVKLINEGKIIIKDNYHRAPNSQSVTWAEVEKASKK